MKTSLSIVLPCYNEAGTLDSLLKQFAHLRQVREFELILVNNGSTDDTREVLGRLLLSGEFEFARVVSIEKNLGYGHGILTGLLAAKGDILAFSHADRQTPPEDILRACERYEALVSSSGSPLFLVRGIRPGREKALVTTRFLTRIQHFLTGFHAEDVNAQPKVFDRHLPGRIARPVHGFSFDAQLLYEAGKAGYTIETVDVKFHQRNYGLSKSAGTLFRRYRTIVSFVCDLISMAWQDRRRSGSIFFDLNQCSRREWVPCLTGLSAAFFGAHQLPLNSLILSCGAVLIHAAVYCGLLRARVKGGTASSTPLYIQSLQGVGIRVVAQILFLGVLGKLLLVSTLTSQCLSLLFGFILFFVLSRVRNVDVRADARLALNRDQKPESIGG